MNRLKPAPASKPSVPKVSDANLRGLFGYNVKRAFSALQDDLQQVLHAYDLRMLTFSALVMIVENPGVRQSQLADALAIERPNLVVILDTLERRELITRDRVATDRRAYALTSTLAGKHLCTKAYAAVQAHEARYLSALAPAERRALTAALNSIEKIFQEAPQ